MGRVSAAGVTRFHVAGPWCELSTMNHIRKDKNNVRPIIFQIVLDALKGLNMSYPAITQKHRAELKSIRKMLAK